MNVLITGGAGFIGSHLADALIDAGHDVRVLDNLDPQVHGAEWDGLAARGEFWSSAFRPAHLNASAELFYGDVRNPENVREAVLDIDAVYHFAAAVGVGQSMYEPAEYVSVNCHGTAVLLEALAKNPVKRLIVASSMSIYGEGSYAPVTGVQEHYRPDLRSVYALTKYDQECLCLMMGEAYGIPTTALRFFNVYGPRQALSNPYTGVLAIFASRLLNDKPPLVYDDGLQSRDFVSVYDVARACMLALDSPNTGVFNVGSGERHTVLEVADMLAQVLGKNIRPELTGTKRVGDIRHCFADIRQAKVRLGYEPMVPFEEGLADYAAWLKEQTAVDSVEQAHSELAERGLVS